MAYTTSCNESPSFASADGPSGHQAALIYSFAVQCQSLQTIDRRFTSWKFGTIQATTIAESDGCLKAGLVLK